MSKTKANLLQVGNRFSETQYYEVKAIKPDTVSVVNERGFSMNISKGIIEEGTFSAEQFDEIKEVTRTELIQIFSNVGDAIFAVSFNKQPKAEDINEAIEQANKGKIIPIKDLKKIVKTAYKGVERTLIGYMLQVETGFGRSSVIDLEADSSKSTTEWDSRIRQVDHRSLNFLIYRGVKYQVKK